MCQERKCIICHKIRPITDLKNTTEISELCHAKRELIFITKNGYGDLVVMSIKAYEELIDTAKIDTAIVKSEKKNMNLMICY